MIVESQETIYFKTKLLLNYDNNDL